MAISDANIATLNAASAAYYAALRTVVDGMAADEELVFTPLREVNIGENNATTDPGGLREAVGTAATDGGTKGDHALDYPVEKASDVTIFLDGAALLAANHLDGDTGTYAGAVQQVKIFTGIDEADSGELEFGISGAAADLAAEVITASYRPGKHDTLSGQIRHVREDETGATTGKGFATSVGNNTQSRNRFKALCSAGIWQSDDAV